MRAISYLMVPIVAATMAVLVSAQPAPAPARLISNSGIAGVRLGMTLDEARHALPAAKFSRKSDGDGAALVQVILEPGESLILSAGEDDPEAPIDWSRRVQTIETVSAAFHTAEGVRPGALVTEVERVFGKTKGIVQSEIEAREYITFDRQPAYLTFRIDYTGIFQEGKRTTTQYQSGARLFSISVSSSRR
jgi:hypothetical protein